MADPAIPLASSALPALDPGLSRRPEAPSIAGVRSRAEAEGVAKEFERLFLSEMLRPMFEGIAVDGPFGGGETEAMFRPMLIEQYANAMAERGGIGIADKVLQEILKLQGLD